MIHGLEKGFIGAFSPFLWNLNDARFLHLSAIQGRAGIVCVALNVPVCDLRQWLDLKYIFDGGSKSKCIRCDGLVAWNSRVRDRTFKAIFGCGLNPRYRYQRRQRGLMDHLSACIWDILISFPFFLLVHGRERTWGFGVAYFVNGGVFLPSFVFNHLFFESGIYISNWDSYI